MKYKQALQTLLYLTFLLSMLLFCAYSIAKPNELQAQIEALTLALENKRQEHHIPGMAIAVVKDDEVIMSQAFGVMNLEKEQPVTTETLFAIGSSSKSFTATLAAMLVDQDKLQWDDEIANYLPEYEFTTAGKTVPITIRDALSHRTGYTRNDLLWASGQANRAEILKNRTPS